MTFRGWIQAAICVSAFGCSQGPSWEPPEDPADDTADADQDQQVVAELAADELQTEIVVPYEGQRCAKIGDFVHLEATIDADLPVTVTWSFERDQPGCGPITLATLDSPTIHTDAYAMFMWSTSCAKDVPDDCGFGPGTITVEVLDEAGEMRVDTVPFCLDAPPEVLGSTTTAVE